MKKKNNNWLVILIVSIFVLFFCSLCGIIYNSLSKKEIKTNKIENKLDNKEKIKEPTELQKKVYKELLEYDSITTDKKWLKTKAGRYFIFCQKHNVTTSIENYEKAANNEIWIGMNYWLLVCQRGNPNSINPSNYGYGTQYQYCWFNWTPSCFYDKDGDDLIDSYN